MLRFGSATFDSDNATAIRADGLTVRFTRSERLLLRYMQENAGRLLNRNQLLDAISEPGSDKSDRTIDFVITRLRNKLNDNAADPRFIATRYGEGYVWVAKPQKPQQSGAGAHLVLGPIRVFGGAAIDQGRIDRLIGALQRRLTETLGLALSVVLVPDLPPRALFAENPPRYSADLAFITTGDGPPDCVVTLHDYALGRLIAVHRVKPDAGPDAADDPFAARIAERITGAIWHGSLRSPNQIEPVIVSLNNAAIALTGDAANWTENDRRLREMLQEQPGNPVLQILLAANIHAKYIVGGPMAFLQPGNDIHRDEDEIEALVTAALPLLQDDPTHAMAAARLLFFLDRGYRPLAIETAEQAHRVGTSVAASFATIGQMRVFLGDIDAGIAALDIALQMTTPNTQYEVYLQVVKTQALHAIGDRDALQQTTAQLYARLPELKFFLEIYYTRPEDPSPWAVMALQKMPPAMATAMLLFGHHVYARHFVQDDHRQAALGPAVRLLCGHFGPAVLPAILRQDYGHLTG